MNAPCFKCAKSGCGKYHDECKEYQDYKRELEERKNAIFGVRMKNVIYDAYRLNRCSTRSVTPENSPTKCHRR